MSLSHPRLVTVLVAGFALVILLMLATGQRGLMALSELERGSSALLSGERASARAVTMAQDIEIALDQIYYSTPGAPRRLPAATLGSSIDALERDVAKTVQEGLTTADEPIERTRWREFDRAARAFIASARGTLRPTPSGGVDLTTAHERVADAVGNLVRDGDRRTERLASLDREAFSRALEHHVTLLALALITALGVAIATVFLGQRLFRRLEEQRQELAKLSSDVLHTQEATLRQVSHDLHDQFGQTLTAIEANLSVLDNSLTDRGSKARVEDCMGLVQDLMGHARSMSQLLRPSILDDFGLSASLEWLADRFVKRTGVQVEFSSTFNGRLPEAAESHLFRIAQEALTNVTRHAGATRVSLTLSDEGSAVTLIVADNGAGITRSTSSRAGMGMRNMRARAEQLGGELLIEPRATGGTRVTVRAPVAAEVAS